MGGRFLPVFSLVVILTSCAGEKNNITGVYHATSISKVELFYRYYFQGVRGTICSEQNLVLNNDSTYIFKKYPFIVTGNWQYDDHNLLLLIKEHHWMHDSLKANYPHDKTPAISMDSIVFRVKGNRIIRFEKTDNGKRFMAMLELDPDSSGDK